MHIEPGTCHHCRLMRPRFVFGAVGNESLVASKRFVRQRQGVGLVDFGRRLLA